jgi:hypothetical protein
MPKARAELNLDSYELPLYKLDFKNKIKRETLEEFLKSNKQPYIQL